MQRATRAAPTPHIFQQVCGCINHDIFTNGGTISFRMRCRSYFVNRKEYAELLNRKLIKPRVSNICTVCLQYAHKKEEAQIRCIDQEEIEMTEEIQEDKDEVEEIEIVRETELNQEVDVNNDIEILQLDAVSPLVSKIEDITSEIKNLNWSKLDCGVKSALCNLSEALGGIINSDIYNEKSTMAAECSSFENLTSIEPRKWYNDRNKLLTDFLHGCTGVSSKTIKEKKFNSCLHAVEQIIYARNNNVVTPFAFQKNIMSYVISKSKTACAIMGGWESSGSYTKINEMLSSDTDTLTMPDNADIIVTFDNEQKVGRHSGRIREGSKQPMSIITTVAVIQPSPITHHQFQPYNRLNYDVAQTLAAVEQLENEYRDIMRIYRNQFITEVIQSVLEEQFVDDNNEIKDYVDLAVCHEGQYICSCCFVHDDLFEICPSCNKDTSFYDYGYDKYFRTKAMHKENKPIVRNAEPCMVNPSGYDNVITVLEQVHEQAISSCERQWVTVICDGVPYVIGATIQDSMVKCEECRKIVRNTNKEDHIDLHKGRVVSFSKPFPEIILCPGPGHIEINMARKLLSFLWVPVMKSLAKYFGFRTPKSQDVFKNGVDHHRSRQVLEICMFSLSKELVLPYVRYCVEIEETPSCNGYIKWYNEDVVSQKYVYMYHITFSYLLSFHLYNEGIRKNNSNNIMAARTTFAPLFFCGHHPKYQLIFLRDICERVNYPKDITSYLNSIESFSVSGKNNGGQGGDFIHEEVNKEIKSFLPPSGIPTKETWRNIIRKVETLKEMKRLLLINSGIKLEEGRKRPKKFHHEMTMVRRVFRKENYLLDYDKEGELVSLSKEHLDHSLCDFNFIAQENYASYKQEFRVNGTFGTKKLKPVFITNEDRVNFAKIETKTIDEIKTKILELANAMPDKDVSLPLLHAMKRRSNKKKHEYISMFYENEKLLKLQIAKSLDVEECVKVIAE